MIKRGQIKDGWKHHSGTFTGFQRAKDGLNEE